MWEDQQISLEKNNFFVKHYYCLLCTVIKYCDRHAGRCLFSCLLGVIECQHLTVHQLKSFAWFLSAWDKKRSEIWCSNREFRVIGNIDRGFNYSWIKFIYIHTISSIYCNSRHTSRLYPLPTILNYLKGGTHVNPSRWAIFNFGRLKWWEYEHNLLTMTISYFAKNKCIKMSLWAKTVDIRRFWICK